MGRRRRRVMVGRLVLGHTDTRADDPGRDAGTGAGRSGATDRGDLLAGARQEARGIGAFRAQGATRAVGGEADALDTVVGGTESQRASSVGVMASLEARAE